MHTRDERAMAKHDLDPTDPYLLDVVQAALAFSQEREKRLHGQRDRLAVAERALRQSIGKAVVAWERSERLRRSA